MRNEARLRRHAAKYAGQTPDEIARHAGAGRDAHSADRLRRALVDEYFYRTAPNTNDYAEAADRAMLGVIAGALGADDIHALLQLAALLFKHPIDAAFWAERAASQSAFLSRMGYDMPAPFRDLIAGLGDDDPLGGEQ